MKMLKSLLFTVVLFFPLDAVAEPVLRIVDEDGAPLQRFEVMIHTADQGWEPWRAGTDGEFELLNRSSRLYTSSASIDVLVRANGYASVLRTFQGAAKEELMREGAHVVLERGREVRLRFQPPTGMKLPDGFMPQVSFRELVWRVEMMSQPENLHLAQSNFNMLNVRAVQDDATEFAFRLPRERRAFVVGVHQPDWLRYYKAGPFTRADFTNEVLTLELPQPASITASLEWGDEDVGDLPFRGVVYRLMRRRHEGGNSYISVASEQRTLDDTSLKVTDLAPGEYMLSLHTEPTGAAPVTTDDINPGRFMARKTIELEAGENVSESFHYVSFDPQANQGERAARVRVIGADGRPAVGKTMKVTWFDGHYGSHTIFDGVVPDDGVVVLEDISEHVPTEVPFGPYSIVVDGETVGFFRVTADTEPQDFEFRLAPKVGDMAPDLELAALGTGERLRLEDLRGKIVFLEFWETGCGPCQPEMAKLNELMSEHGSEWEDDVTVVPVSLDCRREIVAVHVASRGWMNLRHYWSKHANDEYFSDAALVYVVHGVPTALLIDREGKILWRGHPAAMVSSNFKCNKRNTADFKSFLIDDRDSPRIPVRTC